MFQDRCHPWVGQVLVDRHDASFGKPVGLGRDNLPHARPSQHDSVHLIPTNTEWGKGGWVAEPLWWLQTVWGRRSGH